MARPVRGSLTARWLDLFEEAGVVEQRAAQSYGVTGDGEGLREDERRIQEARGLRGCELRGYVHPGGGVDGAVEGGVFDSQASTIPDREK